MSQDTLLTEEALLELPIFPLPNAVLLPGTFISLHIFEPRYRKLMEFCLEGPRAMAIAMLDPMGVPDAHGRPPIHRIAGVGVLRRSARLPDGRYNIVLEGVGRIDLGDELPPTRVFRRAEAVLLLDDTPSEERLQLAQSTASLRGLAARALAQLDPGDTELLETLAELDAPGQVADLVAATLLPDPIDRQRVLEALSVPARLDLVIGGLGARLLKEPGAKSDPMASQSGWGVRPGEA